MRIQTSPATILAVAALLGLAGFAQAQWPVTPIQSGQPFPFQPSWSGMPSPLYYYNYSPRDLAQYSSPSYTHTWQPAYPLPAYQMHAYNYWYRAAYAPYMRATGYTLPALP